MERFEVITFLSDFGYRGGYAAACEAVLASLCPHARVMHLSHEVGVGGLREAATTVGRVAPLMPPAVHLAVVDPDVGTQRRPLVVQATRGDLLVGPDNGLLPLAAAALGGVASAWHLLPERVRTLAGLAPDRMSHTFHGRDLFAPAAALLACGAPLATLAEPLPADTLVKLGPPLLEVGSGDVRAEVTEVDRFGNVALSATIADLPGEPHSVAVEIEGGLDTEWIARVVRTFAELQSGELGLYEDSWGSAALALNEASASELLGAATGAVVRLRALHPRGRSS